MRGARPHRALELAVSRDPALSEGASIAIACSGGPDSVALAALLHASAPRRNWQLLLAHVNHGLRQSANQDEAVALHVASTLRLPIRIANLDGVARDERALRDARYGALGRIAKDAGAQTVVTAHTAEDQTETVLMSLFRGTGTSGLTGMPQRRTLTAGIQLARPLLRQTHGDMCRYCETQCLPYALDPTNEDLGYRRNAVRHALVALRRSFPGLDRAVARAAYIVAEETAGAPRAKIRRRVRAALAESGELLDVDFEHIESAVRALDAGSAGVFYANRDTALAVRRGSLTVKKR